MALEGDRGRAAIPRHGAAKAPAADLVVVSHRLPWEVNTEGGRLRAERTVGGLVAGVEAYLNRCEGPAGRTVKAWVGWPGTWAEGPQRDRVRDALAGEACARPVFVERALHERYYEGFSNRTLWPLCHYVPSLVHVARSEWEAYVAVNRLFADATLEVARPEDMVWVHDYQLLLVPAMLRERRADLRIAYFHHVPFPAYDVFRILPREWARSILDGLLGADVVGFHTYEYARHFLRCADRVLGVESAAGFVRRRGRAVRVDAFPIGVEFERWNGSADDPDVRAVRVGVDAAFKDRRLILSVDRLDYTKGILPRLLAFESLLESDPSLRGRVTLQVVAVPSRTGVEAYRSLRTRIEETVGRVNGRFGGPSWTPVVYQFQSLPFAELAALYGRADVALVTPLRDGMNLVAKEYLATRRDATGVLVLSETAGAARELGEAVLVNPYHVDDLADGLRTALAMPPAEQVRRNRRMRERLERYDVARWGEEQETALEGARADTDALAARRLAPDDRAQLVSAWRRARRRLALLDYDGTLVGYADDPASVAPDEALRALVARLCGQPGTLVVIVSGRDGATLEAWFQGLPVGLVAEHGARRRTPEGVWSAARPVLAGVRERVRERMQVFTDRLPGAFIEEKSTSLAWHWRPADPETGIERAAELAEALRAILQGTNLRVLAGRKVIEVREASSDKGTATAHWLARGPWDVVLAAGDDVTDEDLFAALPADAWSLRVGLEASRARFNVDGPEEMRAVLSELAAVAPAPAKDRATAT